MKYYSLLAVLSLCQLIAAPSFAQSPTPASPSAEEIIRRLQTPAPNDAPKRRTRGISIGTPQAAPPPAPGNTPQPAAAQPVQPADAASVDRIFNHRSRGLSTGERREIANIASRRPAIDLVIYFDFNSADISSQSIPALVELGRALSSPQLGRTRLLIGGHTDAKGSASYNQALSERRAEAIRQFLVSKFRVDEGRLLAIGFGKEQLKNRADPFSGENRRVQVVNLDGR